MSTYSPRARDSGSTAHQRLTAADVMTVAEVADLLRVPVSTVADWDGAASCRASSRPPQALHPAEDRGDALDETGPSRPQ